MTASIVFAASVGNKYFSSEAIL